MPKTLKVEQPEQVAEPVELDGDMNDIACVDCGRKYPLVDGSSNCRCKKCNTLYKTNHKMEFHPHAKKS